MNLSEIRKELDKINSQEMTFEAATSLWLIEEQWSSYNSKPLGQFRAVIDDRLYQAHTHRVAAGY